MKLLSLSGFVPEHIVDVIRFDGYIGSRNISHYCGYASDFISKINDSKDVGGFIFPKTCDSCRVLKSYVSRSDFFAHNIVFPPRKDEAAIQYLASEIKRFQQHLEDHFKLSICQETIKGRISLINKRNQELLSIYNRLDDVSYFEYISHIHNLLKVPLEEQIGKEDFSVFKGNIRGFLVGSFLSSTNVAKIIENNRIKIVGDNLPESGRLVHSPKVSDGEDIYYEISKSMIASKGSPSLSNYQSLIEDDLKEIKEKKVDCVIFVSQKYCEPYEYFYSVYKKKLDELGIPSLKIQLTNSTDDSKVELLVGAFASSLKKE